MATLCRITGSSKGLPKPNYFPLLPPISPADAKKLSLCRITSKSWNLPKHNYIPVFNFDRLPTPVCSVTRGNMHLYTPVIPSGNRKFCDSVSKVIYVVDLNLALIIPVTMEEQIKEGRIETLLMSKDKTTLEVKLNKRRETLQLEPVVEANWADLPHGKGPNAKTRSRATQDLGQIFKNKENQAEMEEKRSVEKIQPNLERVESIKKKLEVSKKAGLPVTLGLRDLEGTYGHLVKGFEGDVTFRPETPDELTAENEWISGQFIEIEKRFVPGRVVGTDKFLPGIVTGTNKGPRFVAGQVLMTKKGQKFFPGQYYGSQFVPGQIIKQSDGEPRFIPGQVIDALEAGPTFIPGQVMNVNGHSSFVPGQVIEVNGEPRFVPGRVIEEDGTIKFQSGELVDTDEGLKWVQFNLQELDADEGVVADTEPPPPTTTSATLALPEDPLDSLRPMTPSDRPNCDPFSGIMESGVLQSLLLAGVEVGDRIVVPSVEVELSEDLHQNRPKLQRSVSINTFSLFNRVLSSMSEALQGIDTHATTIDVNQVLQVVKSAPGGCQATKSLVLTAIAEIIQDSGGEGVEMSPEELKRRVLEKVQAPAPAQAQHKPVEPIQEEDCVLKSILSLYSQLQTKLGQERRMSKILAKDVPSCSTNVKEMAEICESLSAIVCQPSTFLNSAVTAWLQNDSVLQDVLTFVEKEALANNNVEGRIKLTIFEVTDLESRDVPALLTLIEQGIQVSRAMGDNLILGELLRCKNIQSKALLMKKLNSAAIGSLQEVALLQILPESVGDLKTRLAYCEALLEYGADKAKKPEPIEVSVPTPEKPDMRKVEELVNEMIGWDACVIMKKDLRTVVPKEATSKILAGQARYSVLDESGIRFFEPPQPRAKTVLKSFSEEIPSTNHGVRITEVTTPEADALTTQRYEGDFRKSFKGSEILESDDLELPSEDRLDSSVAKSKLAVKQTGKRIASSPRREQVDRRVSLKEERDASIRELVETEEEFLRDMDNLLKVYHKAGDVVTDKGVSESRDVIFGSLPQIAKFHQSLLLEALKSNTDNTKLLGRAFIRLEREFDVHAKYIEEEATAEKYLKENPEIAEFYQDLCLQVDATKSLTEQLRLPNQRLNDYSVLLQELVEYSRDLEEPTNDLEKALELMKLLPQKSGDEKFLNSIEGYKGSMKGLGRLLSHEWFSLTDTTGIKRERYLFLFKGRILVTKVKRITDDRSVFILKDVLRLPDLEVISDDSTTFDLHEPSTGGKYHLSHADHDVKEKWLKEIKFYASDPSARARRQDSVTVDTAFGTGSSDDEKTDVRGRKVIGSVCSAPAQTPASEVQVTKSSSNVVLVKRESLKSESEKGPRILVGMKSMACEPGDSAKFHVKFISESPCSVTWLKDNRPLDDRLADRIKMTAIGHDFTMELLNCHDDDGGLYTARCINEFGSKTSSGMLTVHELTPEERAARMAENSPGFPVKFKDVAVIRDTVACFMIATSGDPLPKLRIYKDGVVLQYNDRVKLEEGEEEGHFDLFINHVVPEDAGVYKVVGTNIYGSEAFSAKLEVVDEKDVFHGLEDGSAPLDFTWFRDGKHFTPEERFKVMFKDDEDTLALIFQHVTPEDAGLYTCVASTNSGKISCSAELTVKGAVHQLLKEPAPPVIKTKLMPTELNATGSGMLEIKTEGFPQPTLTWFKDDTEISAGDKYRFLHEDAESTALIIRNVDVADMGTYKVIATNELGRDESEAKVVVRAPPKFTKEMKDWSALRGSEVIMEISVEGSPAPDIRIYKDGQDLTKNKRVTITKQTKFEETKKEVKKESKEEKREVYSVRIESVEKSDAGSFSAVASNTVGQMSCFWSLEVNSPPRIVSSFEKRIEKEVNETLILEVETEEAEKKITWKIDEEIVDKKHKISSTGPKHRFEWKDLGRDATSKLSVTVSNDYGTDSAETQLVIKRKPEITQKLKPLVINYGESVEFKVKVDAYPKPKVKWFLGDVAIDGKKYAEDGDTYSVKVPNVEASATVKVRVENDYGYDEDSAELTVKRKPEFINGLKDVTVLEEESLDMTINIVGTPTPNLRMFHNGKEVEASARVRITKEATETYHMTFNVVLPSDGGDWTIKATNECGEAESRCKITVEGKPIFEQKLAKTIEVIENEDLELTVTLRGSPEPVIKWVLNNEELKVSKHIKIITDGERHDETFASRLIISKVTMEEGGELSVVAENKHGTSLSSGVVRVIPLADIKGPKFTTQLSNANLVKGEDSELKAVIRGDPQPSAEWFKNGEPLGSGKVAGDTYSFPLTSVSESGAGMYELVAKNEFGEARSQAQVAVLCKPEISGLESLRLSPGQPVVLSAKVSGYPQVSQVEWFKDGLPLPENAGDASFDMTEGVATLKLGPAQKGTQGCYSLRARSDIGETQVKAQVAVQFNPPVFIRDLTNQQVKEGEELVLKCKVTGDPKPELSWSRDGVPITEGISELDGTSTFTCEQAGDDQMGKYKVEAVNSGGMESTEALVTMAKEKPKFVKSLPRRESVNEGECMMLKVKIDGSPKPSVAWLKDGLPVEPDGHCEISQLPDGTCTLQVSNAKPSDRGKYSVILENVEGKLESGSIVDVHGTPKKPVFSQDLTGPTSIPAGKALKLTAKMEGYPLPEVKWQKDGKSVRPSSAVVTTVQPDGSIGLEIQDVSESDAGKYKLILSNDKGEASQEIQVTVGPPLQKPSFSQGLTDSQVVEGFPLELQSSVVANPPPQFSVLKDGEPTTLEVKIVPKDGILRAVVAIPAVSESAGGIYTLQAVNSEGATKSSCTVDVIPVSTSEPPSEPVFVTEIAPVQADEGEQVELVGIVSGNPLPSVEWTKDGKTVGAGTFDGKSVRFHIDNAKPQDAGVYACKLTNDSGTVLSEAPVGIRKVFTKPEFTERFTDTQQSPRRDCRLGACFKGKPMPDVSWFKDDVPIEPSDSKYDLTRGSDQARLTIRNCTESDKGRYSCVLRNSEGSDTCEAEVEIISDTTRPPKPEVPSFLKKINNTELYDGMDARFTACVTGYPEPDHEWFKDGQKLNPGPRAKFEQEGAGLLRLIVPKVTPEDAGTYGLRIFNQNGEARSEGKLKVERLEIPRRARPSLDDSVEIDKFKKSGLPQPLTDKPIISCMTDRHLTLSWKPSLSSVARYPVTYVVEMCEVGGDDLPKSDWFSVRRGLRNCVCDVRNLDPWLDYKFRIRVENEYGISEPGPFAETLRSKFDRSVRPWTPVLTHPIPKDYDLECPPHDGYTHPPRFLNQPHDAQYGIRDSSCQLRWYVYGYPKPDLEFEFNGTNITREIGGGRWAMTYLNNGEVRLFVNRMSDGVIGTYRAIAKNPHGEARQDVHLKLAEHPRFVERPNETWIMLRRDGKASAKITGTPLPHIKFYKDWTPIGESSRLRFKIHEDIGSGFVLVTLELRDSIAKDAGLYSITATNLAGTTHTSFNIRIEESETDYNWESYGPPRPIKTHTRPFSGYYDLGDELGRGTQGVTYHAVDRGSGRSFACKSMLGTGPYREWMQNEVNIMDGLSHRHISRLHDWYSDHGGIRMVTELAGGGDIISSLISRVDVTEWEISSYVRQMLLGLEYLHGSGIAHLGLTPFDILMSRHNGREIMLSDFGLARRIGLKHYPLDYGMPEFVAPEIVLGRGVGYAADIWSVGVITHLLLTGRSLFWGRDDVETMDRIKAGTWNLSETLSLEARDFLNRLLVFEAEGRLDIQSCLNHPWLTVRNDRRLDVTMLTTSYSNSLRSWYSNASCRDIYRRRPLSGAYSHRSRMVYPPDEWTPPRRTPSREPRTFQAPEAVYPRPDLDTEIGVVSSESHYQNGPDTYLLQLRDADFPARLRKYMKVAAARSPAMALQLKGAAYDTDRSIIKERRRFTEIMDEEVDDERKTKINSYGEPRRLRTEVGKHMEVQAEAAALVLSKRDGTVPLFRIRPGFFIGGNISAELSITVVVDGDPAPTIQWFKNDLVVGESNRVKTLAEGNTFTLSISKLLAFDFGAYKVVAGNANGQVTARFRIQESDLPGETIRKPTQLDYTVEEEPLRPVKGSLDVSTEKEIYTGKFSRILETSEGQIVRWSKGYEKELDLIGSLKNVNICNPISLFQGVGDYRMVLQEGGGGSLLRVLANSKYSEQTLCLIVGQILDAINYLHWRGFGLLNLEPGNVLLSSVDDPVTKLCDFSSLQPISRLGSRVQTFTPTEFTAPELLSSEPAYRTTDVWNIGVLLYILLSGHSPFLGETEEDTKANVTYVRFRFEYLFKDLTQEVTRFIMLLFKKSPLKRPSIEECLEHRWLLPSEYMLKKREKSWFAAGLLRQYAIEYYEKRTGAWDES